MKKVIVIGAGIAGLTSAIYAAGSGLDVTLIEQHSITGGTCTSWKRKGYFFEGAVHWLTGSSIKNPINKLWRETGALNDDVEILLGDVFSCLEWNGQVLNLYRDVDKTAKMMKELSPEDSKTIDTLVKDVKAMTKVSAPTTDIKGLKAENPQKMGMGMMIQMFPALSKMGRLSSISCREYRDTFKHEGIRRLLSIIPDDYNAMSLIFTLASLHSGDSGYPVGGSLGMAKRMEEKYKSFGGKLMLNTKVKHLNIENDKVTGLTLENGEVLEADAVIITQETIAAVNQLFETKPNDEWLTNLCQNTKSSVCTFIGVGINAEIPSTPIWRLDEPIRYAGLQEEYLAFNNYHDYENYAPAGGTTLTTSFIADTYDFWKKAYDEGRYAEEKQKLADQVSKAICKKYPGAEGKIDVIDIATPMTYERYTGSYHGSWMSIAGVGTKMASYPAYLESIGGVFFAGHRMMPPGGLPVALSSGRTAAQLVCRYFDATFKQI